MIVTSSQMRSGSGFPVKFGSKAIKRRLCLIEVNITGSYENVAFSQQVFHVTPNTACTIPVTWVNGSDYTCVSASVGTFTQNGLELPASATDISVIVTDTKHRISVELEDTTAVSSVSPSQLFLQQGDIGMFTLTYNAGYSESDIITTGGIVQGNTVSVQAGSTSSSVTISTRVTSYTYFKLDVTAIQGTYGGSYIQVSELELYDQSGTKIPLTYVTGSAGNNSSEGGAKLCDGSTNTKFCSAFTSGGIFHIFRTATPTMVATYRMATGDDTATYYGRNPMTWTLEGAQSETLDRYSVNWTVIDSKSNDHTMGATNQTFYTFNVTGA